MKLFTTSTRCKKINKTGKINMDTLNNLLIIILENKGLLVLAALLVVVLVSNIL